MKALLLALLPLLLLSLAAGAEVAPDSTDIWDFAQPRGPMFGPTLVDTTGAAHHVTLGSVNMVPALHNYDPPCEGYDLEAKARICYQTIPSPFSSMPTVFAFVRWAANDYGTVISRIDIVRPVEPGAADLWQPRPVGRERLFRRLGARIDPERCRKTGRIPPGL